MVSECDLDLWLKVGSQPPLPATTHSWERQSVASSAVRSTAQPSSEPELVKDCLHALQGLPAAVKRLENQSVAYCLQPADKTIHNISTLWTLSSSTSALAKLLHQLALAGSHRCQLDQFVEFFSGPRNTGCQRRPRKKKERPSCGDDRSTDSSPGLLNQAFAAAVRTILQGYSASLDSLLDSLSRRRISDSKQPFGGALFGYGHGLMSLLELFLHTQELRLQLQALTRVCLINTADSETELLSYNMDIFRAFPKGADLLTHLYNLLLEPDPVHVELLRFLFARTCEPYEVFIRSCIYSATLTDPYGEFILEQTPSPHSTGQPLRSTLKVRDGVNAPIFLVQVCAQLLLAGQQLEVLLKHPQTREFAKSFDSFGQEVVEEHLPEDKETEEERIEESVKVSEANIEDTKSGSCDLLQSNFNGDEEYSVNFFLSGYNRGASWLDVGLPKNPFFDGNHLTVYGYVTTLFMEGYDGWDIRSDVLNEDSLMRKLVPELAQVGLLSLKSFKKIDSVDPIRVLLDDNNLPLISVKSCQQEGVHVDHQENDDIFSIQEEKPANREPAPGGGSWVTMLRQTRLQNICNPAEKLNGCEVVASADKTQEEFRKDYQEDAILDVPISIVVEKSIVNEILTQYRLVSGYTVRLLQVSLHLQEHYVALKRYYFMEVGDWADNFITALCSHKWKVSAGKHQLLEVQRMLEAALQKSSCDGDSHAERLYICKDFECHDFINRNSLQAFDFIELGYHVEWPLDLVLTAESFRLYKLIFRQLLRIKHVVFALGEINSSLQVMERSLRKCTLSSCQQKDRFRTLQLFRHQIGHFITALQCYVQSQLLHVIWGDFLHSIQHEIKDMQDIEVVHIKYLNNAVRQCFLSWDVEEVKHCIENIMQCMLDFRASLKNIHVMDETDVCSSHLYSKVLGLRSLFLDNISCLHKYYVKHQVSDFWTALDYNGYFASVYDMWTAAVAFKKSFKNIRPEHSKNMPTKTLARVHFDAMAMAMGTTMVVAICICSLSIASATINSTGIGQADAMRSTDYLQLFVDETSWYNDLVLRPLGLYSDSIPHVFRTWLRNYIAGLLVYFLSGGLWCLYIYWWKPKVYFPNGGIPKAEPIWLQIKVSMTAMPLYTLLPTVSEYMVEKGWTRCYPLVTDVGLVNYLILSAAYLVLVEFGIYWMHRGLHDIKPLYKMLHATHHIYNKQDTLSPFAGLAFHPVDGILQALPHVLALFVIPMHFFTHEMLLFLEAIWTTNIHDCIDGKVWPIMGAAYHTIHHTTYRHNYGHYTIWMDWMLGTLNVPPRPKQA